MHESEQDGARCRNAAMHNEFMCYQHRSDDIPTVIENDPFLLDDLDDRAAIQHAVGLVAARLACNHIDLKRAGLLLQSIQIASSNLTSHDRHADAAAKAANDANANAAKPATDNRQPATVPTEYTDNLPVVSENSPAAAPPRDFNQEEAKFLYKTTTATGYRPGKHLRPATVTDQDIDASVNAIRRRYGIRPVKSTAPQPTTLPNLQAAASPDDLPLATHHLPLALLASAEVSWSHHEAYRHSALRHHSVRPKCSRRPKGGPSQTASSHPSRSLSNSRSARLRQAARDLPEGSRSPTHRTLR